LAVASITNQPAVQRKPRDAPPQPRRHRCDHGQGPGQARRRGQSCAEKGPRAARTPKLRERPSTRVEAIGFAPDARRGEPPPPAQAEKDAKKAALKEARAAKKALKEQIKTELEAQKEPIPEKPAVNNADGWPDKEQKLLDAAVRARGPGEGRRGHRFGQVLRRFLDL